MRTFLLSLSLLMYYIIFFFNLCTYVNVLSKRDISLFISPYLTISSTVLLICYYYSPIYLYTKIRLIRCYACNKIERKKKLRRNMYNVMM